jgi:hypothetical protein
MACGGESDSSSGCVASDGDGVAAIVRRPVSRDLAVILVADDDMKVRGLSKGTRQSLERLGGKVGDRQQLGLVHLRWTLASSMPLVGQRGWVRELGGLERTMKQVTHWLDYEVVGSSWFDPPLAEGDARPVLASLHGHRCLGQFRVWGPLARAVRLGEMRLCCCVPVDESSTLRLVGTPCYRPWS